MGMLKILTVATLYNSFKPPHLDYADIIYDKPSKINICNNIESLQYNAALAVTGAIRGSSKGELYQKPSFEYPSSRRRLRKLLPFL